MRPLARPAAAAALALAAVQLIQEAAAVQLSLSLASSEVDPVSLLQVAGAASAADAARAARAAGMAAANAFARSMGAQASYDTDALSLLDVGERNEEASAKADDGRLIFLPQDGSETAPACLDGSPYAFTFVPAKNPSTKWTLYFQGGGWCNTKADCALRTMGFFGSSKFMTVLPSKTCMNVREDGVPEDCNFIYLNYCDGGSFAGSRAVPLEHNGQLLYNRGLHNFWGTFEYAMKNGLADASEVIVSGESAGGVAAMLYVDAIAERMKQARGEAPVKVRAATFVSYFLDHGTHSGVGRNFVDCVKESYEFHSIGVGPSAALSEECFNAHLEAPHLCFMTPYLVNYVRTPLFIFNSKYDSFQLKYILGMTWKSSPDGPYAVSQYGKDFLHDFAAVSNSQSNGGFVTSCVCHDMCPWSDIEFNGKRAYKAYADWLYGKTLGVSSFTYDDREPNGDSTMMHPLCESLEAVGGSLGFSSLRKMIHSALQGLLHAGYKLWRAL